MKSFNLAVAVLLVAAAAWEACAAPGGGGGGKDKGNNSHGNKGQGNLVRLDEDREAGLAEVFSSLGALGERKRRDVVDGDALALFSGLFDIRQKRHASKNPGHSGGKGGDEASDKTGLTRNTRSLSRHRARNAEETAKKSEKDARDAQDNIERAEQNIETAQKQIEKAKKDIRNAQKQADRAEVNAEDAKKQSRNSRRG